MHRGWQRSARCFFLPPENMPAGCIAHSARTPEWVNHTCQHPLDLVPLPVSRQRACSVCRTCKFCSVRPSKQAGAQSFSLVTSMKQRRMICSSQRSYILDQAAMHVSIHPAQPSAAVHPGDAFPVRPPPTIGPHTPFSAVQLFTLARPDKISIIP